MEKKFEVFVEDIGDWSVGLRSEVVLKAELSENMINQLKEDKTLDEFETKLQALVEEFYAPEIEYRTFNNEDIQAETEYEEEI